MSLVACKEVASIASIVAPSDPLTGVSNVIFADDFETGSLDAWQDGVDSSRQKVVTDPSGAQSGSRYLAVTYPAGRDGGWLTHFLPAPYQSLYASLYVRFGGSWQGGTKIVALYGSRTDDQWSAMGKAGICPSGTDFFGATLVTEPGGNPGALRFYSYYPGMAREPDGTTCYGRYGIVGGSERANLAQYASALTLSRTVWHHVEFRVRLNTPGAADGDQAFWVDGAEWGHWAGMNFRTSDILQLNAVQLTFSSGATGVAQTQELDIDNVVVRAGS